MKKSELKNGAVVELRNGGKYLKVDDTLISFEIDGSFNSLNHYNEDLKTYYSSDFDIIKVNNNVENDAHKECCNWALNEAHKNKWTWIRGEAILDEEEKEYLEAVIKPFKDKVDCIVKLNCPYGRKQFISIMLGKEGIPLPYFEKESMYKGMIVNKDYSLKELGLFEEKK